MRKQLTYDETEKASQIMAKYQKKSQIFLCNSAILDVDFLAGFNAIM